jgi:hypothetical protein
MMQTSGSPEQFLELIRSHVQMMSEDEKSEFREAWLAQVAERQRARPPRYYVAAQLGTEWVVTRFSDRQFLRSVGVDPDGDD